MIRADTCGPCQSTRLFIGYRRASEPAITPAIFPAVERSKD